MSYNKTFWSPGDIITDEKWNNILNNYIQSISAHKINWSYDNENAQNILNISAAQLDEYLNQNTICFFIVTGSKDNDISYRIYYFETKYEENDTSGGSFAAKNENEEESNSTVYYIFRNLEYGQLTFCEQDGYLKTLELSPLSPPRA